MRATHRTATHRTRMRALSCAGALLLAGAFAARGQSAATRAGAEATPATVAAAQAAAEERAKTELEEKSKAEAKLQAERAERVRREREEALRAVEATEAAREKPPVTIPPNRPPVYSVPAGERERLRLLATGCPDCGLEEVSAVSTLATYFALASESRAPSGPHHFVLTVPVARAQLAAEWATSCTQCVPVHSQGGGNMVLYSMVDSPSFVPGDSAPADPCFVTADLAFAAGMLDLQIRSWIGGAGGPALLTLEQYEKQSPSDCQRNLLLYRLSIALQLLQRARQ